MYTNKELEEIYDDRYSAKESAINQREVVLYRKLQKILLPDSFTRQSISNLDLGCGRGHNTDIRAFFTEGFGRVLAVDLSQNVIEHCKQFYKDKENIEFKAGDAMVIEERFNLITAFGFSLFNTSDNDLFLENVKGFESRNLIQGGKAITIIGSFTDFSGNGADSWYMHTKEDLSYIQSNLEANGSSVHIVFPHKIGTNYFGAGFYNFAAELIKLIVKKRRTFFIVIEHG